MANNSGSSRIAMAVLFFTLGFSPWSHAGAGDGTTEAAVRQTLNQGMTAMGKESLNGTLREIHPDSPYYHVTKERISRIFDKHDIKFEVIDFDFLGESGPYAFVRVKEKSTKVSDTDFKNNTTDAVYIFRKHGNQWKFWGEYGLETVFEDD